MHMYNNVHAYVWLYQSNECDFDRPTKKKSASHSILYYLDSWNPRDHGEKKKNLINDSLLSKYVEQSKYEGTEEWMAYINRSILIRVVRKQYLTIVHQVQQKEPNKNTKKKYTFY